MRQEDSGDRRVLSVVHHRLFRPILYTQHTKPSNNAPPMLVRAASRENGAVRDGLPAAITSLQPQARLPADVYKILLREEDRDKIGAARGGGLDERLVHRCGKLRRNGRKAGSRTQSDADKAKGGLISQGRRRRDAGRNLSFGSTCVRACKD